MATQSISDLLRRARQSQQSALAARDTGLLGGIDQFLGGITRPLFRASAFPLEAVNQFVEGFRGQGQLDRRRQVFESERNRVIPGESDQERERRALQASFAVDIPDIEPSPLFMEEDIFNRIRSNPLSAIFEPFKTGTAVSSFAVPGAGAFGGGLGGAVASGALGGGLFGFGEAAPGEEVGGAAQGALLGGATGGALDILGRGLGKIRKFGKGRKAAQEVGEQISDIPLPVPAEGKGLALRAKRLGLKTGTRSGEFASPRAAESAGKTIISEFDQLGLPTGTKSQLANSLDDALRIRTQQADDLLAQSGVVFQNGTDDILTQFTQRFKNAPEITNDLTAQRLLKDLIDLGDNPTASQLNQFRRTVDSFIPDRAFEKSSQELSRQGEAVRGLRDIISNKLKGEPGLARFKNILGRQSTLFSARRAILGSAGRGTKGIGSPLLVSGIRLPLGSVAERAVDATGKLAGGRFPGGGLLGKAAEILAPAARGAQRALQSPLGRAAQRIAPLGVVSQQINQQPPVFGEAQPGVTLGGQQGVGLPISQLPGQPPVAGGGGVSPFGSESQAGAASRAQRAQLAIQLLNQGLNPLDVERVLGLIGLGDEGLGGQLDLTESQRKDLRSIARAEALVDTFERGLSAIGLQESPLAGRISGGLRTLGASTGLVPDEQLTAFNAARQGLISNLSRALGEAGVLTDQDIARAIDLIPSASDSQGEAAIKIQNLKGIFQANREAALSF